MGGPNVGTRSATFLRTVKWPEGAVRSRSEPHPPTPSESPHCPEGELTKLSGTELTLHMLETS